MHRPGRKKLKGNWYVFIFASRQFESIRAKTRENVPSGMCEDSNQPPQSRTLMSLRCPHEESLHPWLSKKRPVKILIRLRECAVWSESSLGAHVRGMFSDVAAHMLTCHYRCTDSDRIYLVSHCLHPCSGYVRLLSGGLFVIVFFRNNLKGLLHDTKRSWHETCVKKYTHSNPIIIDDFAFVLNCNESETVQKMFRMIRYNVPQSQKKNPTNAMKRNN